MADSYLERVAGELADLALADAASTGDEKIVDVIGEILGSSSQTLQEAYLTAVRVRRAEARAREILAKRAGNPTQVKSRLIAGNEEPQTTPDAPQEASDSAAPQDAPQTEEDAAFADVLNTLDEFLQTDDADSNAAPGVAPSRPSQS